MNKESTLPAPPVDPRKRRVVSSTLGLNNMLLELECGHLTKRRLLHAPKSVICTECPAAGGLGGRMFQR